jgi:hypothetical protein
MEQRDSGSKVIKIKVADWEGRGGDQEDSVKRRQEAGRKKKWLLDLPCFLCE